MQEAGRILLMPKGDYAAGTSYEMLDLVNHGGASWVCKKDCTGQEPTDSNTTYWQRFGTAVDMSAINAKTLDGHGAEYFAPKDGLANYLPLTGGTVQNLNIGRHSTLQVPGVVFEMNNTVYGHLGVSATHGLVYWDKDLNNYNVLHTGNKPTGTYTGNGSAESRTISTGGVNASLLHVVDAVGGREALVGPYGAIVWAYSDTTVRKLTHEQAKFNGVSLLTATDSEYLNKSGTTYTYFVL